MSRKFWKKKGKGKNNRGKNTVLVPICRTSPPKKKFSKTKYWTECVDPRDLPKSDGQRLLRKKATSSSSNYNDYDCGCCDPTDEGDSCPSLCGRQICADGPTPCHLGGGSSTKRKGKSASIKDESSGPRKLVDGQSSENLRRCTHLGG